MKNSKVTICIILLLFSIFSYNLYSQPQSLKSYGPGGGGALYSPSISPHNPQEFFIATDMSDLFHTTDFGASYSTVHFKYITAGMPTKVFYTNDPKIVYTIHQHEFGNFPMKSTDGGIVWSKLAEDPTFGGAYELFASDLDFNKVIVTDYTNIYYSTNGGTSFQKIFTGNSGGWGSYIAGVFWDGNDTYICLADGLYSSKNGQAFSYETQTGIPMTDFIVSCTAAKSGGKLRFFAVTNGSCYPGMSGAERSDYKQVYVLNYGSGNWTAKTTGLKTTDDVFFTSMAKNNTDIAYLAGEDNSQGGPSVYKTTDGGETWNNVFNLQNNKNIRTGWSGFGGDRGWSFGEYALGFNVCLTDPNYLIVSDLGHPHVSSDGGTSWSQAYVNKADENPANASIPKGKSYHSIGMEQTTCWYLTWSDKDNIFAGYTDIQGCRSTSAGDSWSFDYTGHSDNTMYFALKHPTNGNLYAAISSVHDMYESQYITDQRIDGGRGKALYSTNKGKDWLLLHDFAHPVIWLAADPGNANKMYATVAHSILGGIYASSNINNGATSSWTKLANPPRTQGHGHPNNIFILNDGSLVCTYSASTTNDRKTWYPSAGVFFSSDGGSTWLDRSDANMQYWTKDITIDPNDPAQNTWYVGVFSGWGGSANNKGGLYKTTNRGVNWTKIMTADRVESCSINPLNKKEMYVSAEYEGLFITSNLDAPTPTFSLVDSYYFKHPLRVFFNPYKQDEIWITSFGYVVVKSQSGTSTINVTSVALNKKTLDLKIDEKEQLLYTILPADATDKSVTWISSHPLIASISQAGLVTALAEGSAWIVIKANDGLFADTCQVNVTKPTGVNDSPTLSYLSIYPNPASDFIEIVSTGSESAIISDIRIFNTLGELMLSIEGQKTVPLRIDISKFPVGIYYIRIQDRVCKFIKI